MGSYWMLALYSSVYKSAVCRCPKCLMSSDSEVVPNKSKEGHHKKFKSARNNQFTLKMTVL